MKAVVRFRVVIATTELWDSNHFKYQTFCISKFVTIRRTSSALLEYKRIAETFRGGWGDGKPDQTLSFLTQKVHSRYKKGGVEKATLRFDNRRPSQSFIAVKI